MTILDALRDSQLFAALPAFRDLASWRRWLVFLKAVYGLPLESDEELSIFRHHTRRSTYAPPPGGYKTAVAVVGRQSGKTRVAGTVVDFEAITAEPEADGTEIFALLVGQDHRAALRVGFSYAAAPFEVVPLLAGSVRERRAESLQLSSGITIAAYPCRPASVRGLRAKVVLLDELAYFRDSEGNPTSVEMLRAVRPTLATTGGRLIVLSSPHGQSGALWDLHRAHFGRDDSATLVWQGSAPEMNPTLPEGYLLQMQEDDPEGYRSEVLGEFRAGVTALFDPEALEAVVDAGVRERLPEDGVAYAAGSDVSGGRRDAFVVAVAHREGDRVVLDALRVWVPPFRPDTAVAEAVIFLQRYRIRRLVGDDYGADFTADAFKRYGLTYEATKLDRSELFMELLPIVNAGAVSLLDDATLLRELRGLERRRSPAGRDKIVPSSYEHDDRAVAVATVVHQLARHRPKVTLPIYRPVRPRLTAFDLLAGGEVMGGSIPGVGW